MATRSPLISFGLVFTLAGFSLAMSGCSTNLATGEKHLNLVSESQEVSMGKEYDTQVQGSLGLYDNPELQRYIQDLGTRIAATSERSNLPWTFRIVDDPVVNAFALPGGFIYVTRGILAHVTDEAQLAGVLGHEIGHVTAKHSVNSMANQLLAQLGLGIGMILAPEEMQKYGELASAALSVLFLKFSRDDESQADHLGVRYMVRVDKDPGELIGVMNMLDRVSQASGGGRIPEWLATHPNPANRAQQIRSEIDTMHRTTATTRLKSDGYLDRLNGLTFGDNPREGYFKGNSFYQPDLKFRFDFPTGWKTANQKQAVLAQSQGEDAILQISLSTANSADAASTNFFSQQGTTAGPRQTSTINGLHSAGGTFSANTEQGTVAGNVAFVENEGKVYQILGYSSQQKWSSYESAVNGAARSFNRLTDPAALSVQPLKIKIVTLPEAMTLEEFAQRYPSAISIDALALANQAEKTTRFKAGDKLKQIVGQKPQK
jgi:predicted Zn-dependent protease